MAKISASKTANGRGLTELVRNILLSKGLSQEQIQKLAQAGVRSKDDFKQIGDAETLAGLTGLPLKLARKVMAWALGTAAPAGDKLVVESADVVFCVHCGAKQPKDYKSGDQCGSCGKQAEPIMACFWCGGTGPGKFCRHCAAEYVPAADLELAILLKREGVPKSDIPEKLRGMSKEDKAVLWGRARRY